MNQWVLIIQLLSPGGDYMDKIPVEMPTKTACVQAVKDLPKQGESPMGIQYKGLCVTMDHWTGKKKDKGVAFD
jgi:hypothetical protein